MDSLVSACNLDRSDRLEAILEEDSEVDTILNQRNKDGTTALHEACCQGNLDCVRTLLKHGAHGSIWDKWGSACIHYAAYNNHLGVVELLLEWSPRPCEVDCPSRYDETPLHMACLRGHLGVAEYLVKKGANPLALETRKNTPLHYASSSGNARLLQWLLGLREDVRESINRKNQYGQTAAHLAVVLGGPASVGVLLNFRADFSLRDAKGHSALHLADTLNNTRCLGVANRVTTPPPVPSPPIQKEALHASASVPLFLTQRSQGSDSFSSSPQLRRRGSTTGTSRPVTLKLPRRDSLPRRGSRESMRGPAPSRQSSLKGPGSEDDLTDIYVSKKTAHRLSRNLERQDSKSWEDTQQVLYDNTAYEPPPGMEFTHPIKRDTLSFSNRMVFSEAHGLKLRVSENHWLQDREGTLEVCLCASMHFNHSYPPGYSIVSPICFVSCKTERPCEIRLTLPHALAPLTSAEDRARVTLLSTTTVASHLHPHSPLFSPSERTLAPLPGEATVVDAQSLQFKTTLVHPSLFAVGVRAVPGRLLPLRCSLFVTYPYLEPEAKVPGFDMEAYIGMTLPTVSTAMRARVEKEGHRFEEKHFTLASESLHVSGSLSSHPADWDIEPRGRGELRYSQVALTQDTDSDSYSHTLTLIYPPSERFFIEPKNAATAVKCRLAVADRQRELCSILATPYTPKKEPTPERTPPPPSRAPSQFSHNGRPWTANHSHHHHSTPRVILNGYDSNIRVSEV